MPCRCIPRAECFAQPENWRFSVSSADRNRARRLRAHEALHAEYASQAPLLAAMVSRTRRSDDDSLVCDCGQDL